MHKFIIMALWLSLSAVAEVVHVKEAHVAFAQDSYVVLDAQGIRGSSENIKVLGSFSLQGETSRRIDIRPYAAVIAFPTHNIIVVRQNGDLYLLDLQMQKEIGHITLPSHGAPNFIAIEPNQKGMTDVLYGFRYLPEKADKPFRPGPLVEYRLVFSEGSYALAKKGEEDE